MFGHYDYTTWHRRFYASIGGSTRGIGESGVENVTFGMKFFAFGTKSAGIRTFATSLSQRVGSEKALFVNYQRSSKARKGFVNYSLKESKKM